MSLSCSALTVAQSACLGGLPHADVALGVNVAQAGDGAVRAGEIRAVDDDLVAGEQAHRVAELLILLAEVTEGDVVARGVLHAGEHALGAELGQKLPGKLGVHADGDVIGEDRKVELLVEDAEVLLDLGKAAEGIEGAVATRTSAPSSCARRPCSSTRSVSVSMMPTNTGTR